MDDMLKATCVNCRQKLTVIDTSRPRGTKIPVLLQCSHTVCEKCLMAPLRDSGSVTCEKCKHESKLDAPIPRWSKWEETLTEAFPLNLYLLGAIAVQQRRIADEKNVRYGGHCQQKDKTGRYIPAGFPLNGSNNKQSLAKFRDEQNRFHACVECEKKAAVLCKSCSDFYCDDCFNKCHQFKSQKKHEKIPIGKVETAKQSENEEKKILPEKSGGCTKHEGQKLDFFCTTCDLYCCSYCVAVCEPEHMGHEVRPMSEIGKEIQFNLLVAKEEGIVQKNIIEKELATVNEDTKEANNKTVVETVINHFASLHGRLQNIENRLLKSIISFLQEESKNTEATVVKLQEHINDLNFLLLEADRAITKDSATDMAKILKQLKSLKNETYIVEKNSADTSMRFTAQETIVYDLDNHFSLDIPTPCSFSFKQNDDSLLSAEDMEKINANPSEWATEKLSAIETALTVSRSTSIASLTEKPQLKPESVEPSCPSSRASSVASSDITQSRAVSQTSLVRGYIAPESTEAVKVSHISTLSSFYILRTTDEKFLKDLTIRIQKYVVKNKHHPTEITLGSLYLVVYGEDNRWYRGRVTDIQNSFVEVVYIDYGNSECVPKTKLRPMPIEFTNIPPLAIHCSIANVHPRGQSWDIEAVRWFASMVDGVTLLCRVFAVTPSICYVDLGQISSEDSSIPISISDALLFLEFGQIAENVPSAPNVQRHHPVASQPHGYAAQPVIAVGQITQVMVSHIDSPSHFYVQQMGETVNYIYSISKELNDTYFQPPSKTYPTINKAIYSPTVGMACAVQFTTDKQWYRAQVTGLPGNKMVEVHYIDYGNEEVVPYTDLRRVTSRTLRIPPLAFACSLSDVKPIGGEWSQEAIDFLKKLATSSTLLSMCVNSKIENKLSVNLYEKTDKMDVNFNGLLVEKGYALSTGLSSKCVSFVKPSDVLSDEAKEMVLTKNPKKQRKRKQDFIPEIPKQVLEDATPHLPVHEGSTVDPYKVEVKLLKAEDPYNIHVVVKSYAPHVENLFDEMQDFYAGSVAEDVDWEIGMNCAYMKSSEENPGWHRGVVTDILNTDHALVSLTDIMEVVEAKFSELRPLRPDFSNKPNPFKCRLAGVIPTGGTNKWSKAACEFVDDFVKKHTKSTFISKKGEIENKVLPADVYVRETFTPGPLEPSVDIWHTLSEKLIEVGLALPKRGDPKLEPSLMSDVIQELEASCKKETEKVSEELLADVSPLLPANSQLSSEVQEDSVSLTTQDDSSSEDENLAFYTKRGVLPSDEETLTLKWLPPTPIVMDSFQALPTYVDDQGFIYFHDYFTSVPQVKDVQAALQETYQGSHPKPEDKYWHPGQLCIAQYHLDGHWYRGQFLQYADKDKGIVMFVDYGNVETCDVPAQLRKATFRIDVPMLAYKCYLYNVQPVGGKWSTAALDLLHKLLVDSRCKITPRSASELGKPMMVSMLRSDGLDPAVVLVNENYASFKKVEMPLCGESQVLPFGTNEPVEKSHDVLCALAGHPVENKSARKEPICSSPTDNCVVEEQVPADNKQLLDNVTSVNAEERLVSRTDEIDKILAKCDKVSLHPSSNTNGLSIDDDGSTIESQSDENNKSASTGFDLDLNALESNELQDHGLKKWYDIIEKEEVEGLLPFASSLAGPSSASGSSFASEALKYRYEDLPDSDEFEVTVLGVESPTTVMICCHKSSKEEEEVANSKYEELLKTLQVEAPKQPQLYNPRPGDVCIACYGEDDTWYRARVVEVDLEEETVVVQYVDYANYETLPYERAVAPKPEWIQYPVQARPCNLWKIEQPAQADELEVKTNLEGALIQRRVLAIVKDRTPVLSAILYNLQRTELAYATLLETELLNMLMD